MDILFFVVAFLSSIVGAICGIGGDIVGRKLNKKWTTAPWAICSCLMVLIVGICVYNAVRAFLF